MDLKNTSYEEDLKLMELIPREHYIQIYSIIRENMWEECEVPTIGDIVDFVNEEDNERISNITEFLDNEEKLRSLLDKESSVYSNEESESFIDKVISSNVTDISDAGWFYKKLMASTDDIVIIEDDCMSRGVKMQASKLSEDEYNYKVRFSFIEELGEEALGTLDEFLSIMDKLNLDSFHLRTPARCNNAPNRRLCKRCVGKVKKAMNSYYVPMSFGVFSTLMITEHATQASLDSMNKGKSENINHILDRKMKMRRMDWEDVLDEIDDIVDYIGNMGVQSRFYEVAVMSRMHEMVPGKYTASSFQYSITHQEDALGAYTFSATKKNLTKLVNSGEFNANSVKSQIMFDIYKNWEEENKLGGSQNE